MSQLLRIDSYALAQPDGTEWQTEWCIARQDAKGDWQFGGEGGELLQPKHTGSENNEYLEAKESRDPSHTDLTYFQLQGFLPEGGRLIDLSAGGGIDRSRLESLLGVLEALGYAPRGVFPTALLATRGLSPGHYGIIELGRVRSWISVVDVQPGWARLESVREYGDFGFYHLFIQWMENVAEAFATQHRFDIHRNLARNREQLFGQMRQAFAEKPEPVQLSLDSRTVTLEEGALRARWPKPAFGTEGLELLLLPPLTQTLPLPEQGLGLPCCDNPAPGAFSDLAAALPEGGQARRCLALSF